MKTALPRNVLAKWYLEFLTLLVGRKDNQLKESFFYFSLEKAGAAARGFLS